MAPDTETTIAEAEGLYPDYSCVVPPEEREWKKTALVDPARLARVLKAPGGVEHVRISIIAEDKAIRFDGKTAEGCEVLGVMMPLVSR